MAERVLQLGSFNFETYNKNLRRIMWAEFLDEQLRVARMNQFRASIVERPFLDQKSIVLLINQVRHDRD